MTEPNYLEKLRRLIAEGKILAGEITNVVVAHDAWCSIYRGEPCDCDPDIHLMPQRGDA